MCLSVDKTQETKFLKRHKGKKRVAVWKIVEYSLDHKGWHTPFMWCPVKGGWFRATNFLNVPPSTNSSMGVGAIHVCTTRKEARNISQGIVGYTRIIKCEALLKDLIGVGAYDNACFSKVWIPKNLIRKPHNIRFI